MKKSKSFSFRNSVFFLLVFNFALLSNALHDDEKPTCHHRFSVAQAGFTNTLHCIADFLPRTTEKAALYLNAFESHVKNAGVYCLSFIFNPETSEEIECEELDEPRHLAVPIEQAVPVIAELPGVVPWNLKEPEETPHPVVSKRLRKFEERCAKAKKNLDDTGRENIEKPDEQIHVDVKVVVLPETKDDIARREDKIKALVFSLAHGEHRGRLKRLHHMGPNSYSMRLTKKDRLTFQVIEGDLKNGVRAIRVLSAQGHYENLEKEMKRKRGQKEEVYAWAQGK